MYYIAIIIFIAACSLVAYIISFFTGIKSEITFGIAFVLVILGISALSKRQKNIPKNRENDYILTWSQRGYSYALDMLNKKLSDSYRITYEEENIFKTIFDNCIAEKKKSHFEENNTGIIEVVFKNEKLWLMVALRDYCYYNCLPNNTSKELPPMLTFVEKFSKPSSFSDDIYYYNKYELTDAGIVAKKILLSVALHLENKNSTVRTADALKKEIDRGWVFYQA